MTGAAPAVGVTISAAPLSPATSRVNGETGKDDDEEEEERPPPAADRPPLAGEPKRPL